VVVPVAHFLRLRALERIASAKELNEAADAARVEELDALECLCCNRRRSWASARTGYLQWCLRCS
jgi:hypothetical protein